MPLPSLPDTLLGVLTSAIAPLSSDTPTLEAYEAFKHEPTLYAIAVVDSDGVPVGLINRFKFLEVFSRPFAHDLFKHQTVAMIMDAAPLVVDEHVALDQLSHALVDSGTRYIFDGFIVTRQGRYLGIGTGYSLMRLITEREHATLFHLAHHDSLTGLPNRQLFADRLTQALSLATRHDKANAVLYIDVDRLKTINDGLGHVVGDFLIRSIADRLAMNVRAEDTVSRLGGDEFGVILTELHAADEAEVVARKLLAAESGSRTTSTDIASTPRAASASPCFPPTARTRRDSCGPPTPPCITRSVTETRTSATRPIFNIRTPARCRHGKPSAAHSMRVI